MIFNEIYKKRLLARTQLPLLSAQDIILGFKMPKDFIFDINDEIDSIYKSIQKFENINLWSFGLKNNIVDSFTKNNGGLKPTNYMINLKNYTVYALLKYPHLINEEARKEIEKNSQYFRIVTSNNLNEVPEFIKLKCKNDYYNKKNVIADNNKVLTESLDGSLNKFYLYQDLIAAGKLNI